MQDPKKSPACDTGETWPIRLTSWFIGLTQNVIILATVSSILVAVTFFLLTALHSFVVLWEAWVDLDHARIVIPEFLITVLEIINGMLKGVIFYIIGIGYFSLFICPLPLCKRLGLHTMHDIELKVVSVIILIMSLKLLEEFVHWESPMNTLLLAMAFAVGVLALLAFQRLVLLHGSKNQTEESL